MPNTFTLSLSGQKELEQELKAVSAAIAADGLRAAALACAGPILTAMQDHAPPEIPDRDITAEVVAADGQHVEVDVSVTGSSDILTQEAQQTIQLAVAKQIAAALAAATDALANAFTRVM